MRALTVTPGVAGSDAVTDIGEPPEADGRPGDIKSVIMFAN